MFIYFSLLPNDARHASHEFYLWLSFATETWSSNSCDSKLGDFLMTTYYNNDKTKMLDELSKRILEIFSEYFSNIHYDKEYFIILNYIALQWPYNHTICCLCKYYNLKWLYTIKLYYNKLHHGTIKVNQLW